MLHTRNPASAHQGRTDRQKARKDRVLRTASEIAKEQRRVAKAARKVHRTGSERAARAYAVASHKYASIVPQLIAR